MREGPPARRPPSGQGQPLPAAPGWTALLLKEPPRLGTSCSFRQGCKRRERNRSSRQDGVGSRAGLSCSLACCSPGLGSTWNFRTFPYLVLARLALVPTQMASTVQIADVSGWAFHGPIEQKAKLRTPVGPRAKGAIYCPQPQRLIPDLPPTERSPLPRYIHSAVGRLHPPNPPPMEASLPSQRPGAAVLSASPWGLETWASTRPLRDSDAREDRQRRLHHRQAPRLRPGAAPTCHR